MQNISTQSQKVLDFAKSAGISMDKIIEKYGLRFAIKLIRNLTKKDKSSDDTGVLDYPKAVDIFKKEEREEYLTLVEDSGFKFDVWSEDFIDEDTGEIVTINRWKIYYIGYPKN